MFKTRLLSGILLVIIALATIISGDYVLFFTLLAVSLIGMRELYRAMKVQDEKINLLAAAGYLGAVLYYLAVLLDFERYGVLAIIFGLVLLMFVYVFTYPTYEAGQVMPALFGIVYVAVMLSFIYLTRELPGGKFHVWLIFLCSWGCDTCAYCVGMLIGRHKMAPILSPKKSVEGGVGGVAGAALLGAIYAAATIIYMETIVIYYGSITDTVITETSGGDRMAQQKLGQTRSDNVIKKEMIAMLLAGGQGSRLGVLTANVAKPAVSFGGKYRIIDFPLSNCINSGIDTVGVLTQYQPLRLNSHIGIGIPWDLDRNNGGVAILPPYEKSGNSEWYTGTANAIFQNMDYMEQYNPDYVLILSGDHIYKMDYEVMLDFHKENNADVTIATMPVPIEEASRFGIVIADDDKRINAFEEKPVHPRSNLASMGIYIFSWPVLKEALLALKDQENCDFGKHVIPYCFENDRRMFAYEFNGYWKDVGTLGSYWEANMELVDLIPEFNLYEEYWKIYTKNDAIEPLYIAKGGHVERSIMGEGCECYGHVEHSVIGANVKIGRGAVIRDSIIMCDTEIGSNVTIDKSIIAENCKVGDNVTLGFGQEKPNVLNESIYSFGLVTIGEDSVIPDGVKIGKNTAISGVTYEEDYKDGVLEGGEVIIKAGDGK